MTPYKIVPTPLGPVRVFRGPGEDNYIVTDEIEPAGGHFNHNYLTVRNIKYTLFGHFKRMPDGNFLPLKSDTEYRDQVYVQRENKFGDLLINDKAKIKITEEAVKAINAAYQDKDFERESNKFWLLEKIDGLSSDMEKQRKVVAEEVKKLDDIRYFHQKAIREFAMQYNKIENGGIEDAL